MKRALPKRLPKIPGRSQQNDENQNFPQNPQISNVPNPRINPNQPSVNDYISNVNNQNQSRSRQDISQSRFQDTELIKLQRRIRYRHDADGAININLQREDLMNDKLNLYDNKDINYDLPKIKENIDLDNTEYYIESIHHDKYFKILQKKKEEKKIEKKTPDGKLKDKKIKRKRALNAYELAQATENKIFSKFDQELSNVISRTLSKVTLIFLFTQGLLAGIGLMHIITVLSFKDDEYKAYLKQYSRFAIVFFNIFHALTFSSLVGNGIKFISSYQKYSLINIQLENNLQQFTRLRQNMIFSGILLVFFTLVFFVEIYLATYIQEINLCKDSKEDVECFSLSDFNSKFKFFHLIIDFVVIILFILNIFDVNIQENEENLRPTINVNYYLGSEENPEEVELITNQ